jgi:hypothetical protein
MGAAVSESTSTQVKLTTVDRSKNAPAPSGSPAAVVRTARPVGNQPAVIPIFSQWSTSPASDPEIIDAIYLDTETTNPEALSGSTARARAW